MDAIEFLKKAHDVSCEHSKNLRFDKKDGLHFNLIALYGSLIEFSSCIVILLERNGKIGIPAIFRSLLEAYVDFCNLIKDPAYFNYMQASDLNQWIKLLKKDAMGENPYLSKMSTLPDLKDFAEQKGKELKKLEKDGYRELKIFEKFDRANMEREYRSLYNLLCSASHSNLTALFKRHTEINREDFEVFFYKDEPKEDFIAYIDGTSGTLVNASIKIHDYFKTDSVKTFQDLKEELESVRKESGIIT